MNSAKLDIHVVPEKDGRADISSPFASYVQPFSIRIVNNEPVPCLYKVLTQHPAKYLISPPYGLLGPNSVVEVQVRLNPPKVYFRYDPLAKQKNSGRTAEDVRLATATAFELATASAEGLLEEEADELAETVRRANRAAQSGSSAFPLSVETLSRPVTSVVKVAKKGVQTMGLHVNELSDIKDYLESSTASTVFKVSLAVVQGNIGNSTPSLRFLERRKTLNKIAAEHVAAVYRRMKGRGVSKERNLFDGLFDTVRTVGGILSGADDGSGGDADVMDMSAGRQLLIDPLEVTNAASAIHREALELFDHLWETSTLHSTHTVAVRTVAESITEFFRKIAMEHNKMLAEAKKRKVAALAVLQKLWKEMDEVNEQEKHARVLLALYRNPSTTLSELGVAAEDDEVRALEEHERRQAATNNDKSQDMDSQGKNFSVVLPRWVLALAACASVIASVF